jgi:hypothetical protein
VTTRTLAPLLLAVVGVAACESTGPADGDRGIGRPYGGGLQRRLRRGSRSRIAFVRYPDDSSAEVMLMNADGSNLTSRSGSLGAVQAGDEAPVGQLVARRQAGGLHTLGRWPSSRPVPEVVRGRPDGRVSSCRELLRFRGERQPYRQPDRHYDQHVFVANTDGSSRSDLTPDFPASLPTWTGR